MSVLYHGLPGDYDEQRLKALRQYDILDSFPEQAYDDITRLAAIICNVPMALVSIVDKDRQWFKSKQGLDADETHRQHSFCSHAIVTPNEPFIVEDSRLDERFKNNPLVTGAPNIVFYAGIPLKTKSGFGLGSFCILDVVPRQLTAEQVEALQILSRQVMALLDARKAGVEMNLQRDVLELKNKNLDAIVAKRVAEVEQEKVKLEKSNKELEAFNYISSHDLQEPLRKIQTFTSLIQEREAGNLSEKGKELFSKIGKASSRMSHLITDLLAYSRTTNSKKIYAEIQLGKIVDEVKLDLYEEIAEKHATVTLNGDGVIKVINFQFRQVLYNLVSNSLKFSRPDVTPVINITYKAVEKKAFTGGEQKDITEHHISVSDNGVGFDNKYGEKIFELFQRLQNKDAQIGTGIGLAIVKKIIDNHNGSIVVNSTPGEGTVFTIILPE